MVSAYDKMEEDGKMMSPEDLAFYQQTKRHVSEEHKVFAKLKNYGYESLTHRYHNSSSQYNPRFVISEGEQFCDRVIMEQNIDYITPSGMITWNTKLACTAADWEENIDLLMEYVSAVTELHNLYGQSQLTEEELSNFISKSLPEEAPTNDVSYPDHKRLY